MENKVTHAPKAVIDELDKLSYICVFELFATGAILDANSSGYINSVEKWVYCSEGKTALERELAVIKHLFGNERLQPEREPRYYTIKKLGEPIDLLHGVYVVNELIRRTFHGKDFNFIERTSVKSPEDYSPDYVRGMSYAMAKAIADETGAKIEEIK
jgi:hypothetical protein